MSLATRPMRRDVLTLSIHHTKSFIIFEQINFARFIYQRVYTLYTGYSRLILKTSQSLLENFVFVCFLFLFRSLVNRIDRTDKDSLRLEEELEWEPSRLTMLLIHRVHNLLVTFSGGALTSVMAAHAIYVSFNSDTLTPSMISCRGRLDFA